MRAHLSKERLGYQIHTNRELGMMLRGEKPLAVFSDFEDVFPQVLLRYLRIFDRYVLTGRFVKREHRASADIKGEAHILLTVLFAVPAEAWRIDEMINLRSNMSAWTAEQERKEGTLLGYTDEQNDIWIASNYMKR